MFDDNNETDFFDGEDFNFDLGSDEEPEFNPFDKEEAEHQTNTEVLGKPAEPSAIKNAEVPAAAEPSKTEKTKAEEEKHETKDSGQKSGESAAELKASAKPDINENPFEKAIARAEEKQAADAKAGLIEKLPVFSYTNATEEIAEPSKTFDQLRNEKAEDFPELDDGTSVTWRMEYGKITKPVPAPKKTTIAEMKTEMEQSKEFLDSLKKIKGEVVCKVIPSVSAKKKGMLHGYKGIFQTVEEAKQSGKTIAYVPSDDGRVYQIRCNRVGTFIARADHVNILPKVRAGFTPALPKIPYQILDEVIAFFRSLAKEQTALEAVAFIYWSFADSKYYAYVPKQDVSETSVDFSIPEIDSGKFLQVLEIHSHNTMHAFFSDTDNKDEKATGLYLVIGRLDRLVPEILLRMSVGGKFKTVEPSLVFELPQTEYPQSWRNAVREKAKHGKETGGALQ